MKQHQRIEPKSGSCSIRYHQQHIKGALEGSVGADSLSALRRNPPSAHTIDLQAHHQYRKHPDTSKSNFQSPKPLVLDASSCSSGSTTTPYSTKLAPPPSNYSSNFLRNIWKERKPSLPNHTHHHTLAFAASSLSSSESQGSIVSHQHRYHQHGILVSDAMNRSDASTSLDGATAATIAREAAHAGFLCKLGQNVPAWKRRFFVLERPRANLYYFLSPNDSAPRGCLDLEGAQITPLEDVPDVWRLEMHWPETGKAIRLEARSQQVRDEWVQALRAHQFAAVEHELHQTQHRLSACHSRIGEVERELKQFKLVELELQASQREAQEWKTKFQLLDDSLRRLNQQLRRTTMDQPTLQSDDQPHGEKPINQDAALSPPTSEAIGVAEQQCSPESDVSGSERFLACSMRDSSLLDASLHDDFDVWTVPGTHFSGLVNSCEQLQQSVRLSQVEATQAVADCSEAQKKVELIEKRMEKAEKHLCTMWEENCTLRKEVKQKKRERQMLAREVKALREASIAKVKEKTKRSSLSVPMDADTSYSNGVDEDEEQLLSELEAHVLSSIRLHEQLLETRAVSSGQVSSAANAAILEEKDVLAESSTSVPTTGLNEPHSRSASVATTATATSLSSHDLRIPRPTASLFDNDSDSGDDDDCDVSLAASISSMVAESDSIGPPQNHACFLDGTSTVRSRASTRETTSMPSPASTPERPNPTSELDEGPQEVEPIKEPPPVVMNNGHATSKLRCPFADVVESAGKISDSKRSQCAQADELEVYHLTFYTRKIGLQFQKIPPPPSKAMGLLNDAISADLCGNSNEDSSKTAAELRRIGAISSSAKVDQGTPPIDEFCEVAQPVDAVIVCGFAGFDDAGSNLRPRLGARLVAFDGVSVERGLWTFESIRKAIQARNRPLTLSFRNDFLTTEQRSILTEATIQAQRPSQPPRQRLNLDTLERRPSFDPSVHSALSHGSDNFGGRAAHVTPLREDDLGGGLSVRSDASCDDQFRRSTSHLWSSARSAASSGTQNRHSFRSFSDAGSSVSMISAVAPLISNLLYRSSEEPFTPDYLVRKPEPVEHTLQHQDFQSELL